MHGNSVLFGGASLPAWIFSGLRGIGVSQQETPSNLMNCCRFCPPSSSPGLELGHALNQVESIPVRPEAKPDDLGWTTPHLQSLHVPHNLRHHLGDAGLPQCVPSPNSDHRYCDRSFCGKVSCGLRVQNLESWTKSLTLPFGIHLSHDFTKRTNKGKYFYQHFTL